MKRKTHKWNTENDSERTARRIEYGTRISDHRLEWNEQRAVSIAMITHDGVEDELQYKTDREDVDTHG